MEIPAASVWPRFGRVPCGCKEAFRVSNTAATHALVGMPPRKCASLQLRGDFLEFVLRKLKPDFALALLEQAGVLF